jgi:hypothetical protein
MCKIASGDPFCHSAIQEFNKVTLMNSESLR